MVDRTVKVALVCQLLDVHITVAGRWEKDGHLKRIERGRYLVADVDSFLRDHAHNFVAAPTWEDLRSRRIVLVRHEQAMACFNVAKRRLDALRRSEEVAYIKFPGSAGSVRYCLATLRHALTDTKDILNIRQTAKVVGLSVATTKRLIQQGEMERVRNLRDPSVTYVSRQSVVAYLSSGEVLPSWVGAEDWIEDCLSTDRPLVRPAEAAMLLNIRRNALTALLKKHQAWFLKRTQQGTILLSPVWLDAFLEYAQPYDSFKVARLFGVEASTVRGWKKLGLITCPIPGHAHPTDDSYLWETCWAAYIEQNVSPHARRFAPYFIPSRTRPDPRPLLSVAQMAKAIGCTSREVVTLAESGGLIGIRNPGRRWVFTEGQVAAFKRKQRAVQKPP